MSGRARSAGLAATLAVVGCAAPPPPAPLPCPRAAILDGAQTVERRIGAGPIDFAWRAAITGVTGGCRYDDRGVELRHLLDLAIVPGPRALATGETRVALPWFVAVVDPSGAVVDKQVFTLETPLPEGPQPRLVSEQLEQRIAAVRPEEGPGWRIYFGFELDPEEARRRLRERAR